MYLTKSRVFSIVLSSLESVVNVVDVEFQRWNSDLVSFSSPSSSSKQRTVIWTTNNKPFNYNETYTEHQSAGPTAALILPRRCRLSAKETTIP
ncbi:hypothetical protein JTB14_014523 [Gonioctena quinquepunctata]|nr:hypothetical protein JTB14_014523 [Gonioctena quinquepunctata]